MDDKRNTPPGLDKVEPINLSPPVFVMIPEDKGDKHILRQQQDYDPEPDEEKWLKNIGATLISKTVKV